MKLSITREVLLEKLSIASRFTSARFTSVTSLQGIYLEGKGDKIEIYSTNLSSFFKTVIKIKEGAPFRVVIEPKKVMEVLALLQPGIVEIEIDGSRLLLTQGKTKSALPVLSPEDFPLPPELTIKTQKIKTDFLTNNLPMVLFSASTDETRPVLTGVNFLVQDSELLIIATDGFRLSLLKSKKELEIPSMLVPHDFLNEVLRLTKDEEEIAFGYSQTEKMIMFRTAENEFYSRLIEGEFPDFEKVMPVDKKTTVILDREEFLRNIKLISVVARDFSNIVLCDFKKNGLYLRPKTDGEDANEAFQEVEIEGEEQKVAFNSRFLTDFLNNVSSKKLTIEVLRPDAPIVFKTEDKKDFLHVIMPIRIQQ